MKKEIVIPCEGSKTKKCIIPVKEDQLDWDFFVPAPLPKTRGTFRAKFVYRGPSRPIPDADPFS